jgi:hypothetical protein
MARRRWTVPTKEPTMAVARARERERASEKKERRERERGGRNAVVKFTPVAPTGLA